MNTSGRLRILANHLLPHVKKPIRRIMGRHRLRPRVRWGNIRRVTPFSPVYGFDRGTPVDRYFIEQFLSDFRDDIRGVVLEVRDPEFATKLGNASTVDVVDVDPRNDRVTVIADLSRPGSLPPGRYSCFVFTQTLQYEHDPEAALRNAWDCLAEGGSLLVTVPSICRLDPTSGYSADYWRFTPAGFERVVRSVVGADAPVEVRGYGNALAAVAFIMGIAAEEITTGELASRDEAFPVVVCVRVIKQGEAVG